MSECLVLGLELAWVHRQVVDEPPVAGDELLGLGRLGVPHDAGPVPGVDLMDEGAGVESIPLPSPGNCRFFLAWGRWC